MSYELQITVADKARLETALNHHIGELVRVLGKVADAFGEDAPQSILLREEIKHAERLSDKLLHARERVPMTLIGTCPL